MRSVIASKINLLQIAMAILFFKIAYNLLCSEMLMGGLCIRSQEHFTTMVCEKFEGQTECIMVNWKVEKSKNLVEVPAGHVFYF